MGNVFTTSIIRGRGGGFGKMIKTGSQATQGKGLKVFRGLCNFAKYMCCQNVKIEMKQVSAKARWLGSFSNFSAEKMKQC